MLFWCINVLTNVKEKSSLHGNICHTDCILNQILSMYFFWISNYFVTIKISMLYSEKKFGVETIFIWTTSKLLKSKDIKRYRSCSWRGYFNNSIRNKWEAKNIWYFQYNASENKKTAMLHIVYVDSNCSNQTFLSTFSNRPI